MSYTAFMHPEDAEGLFNRETSSFDLENRVMVTHIYTTLHFLPTVFVKVWLNT